MKVRSRLGSCARCGGRGRRRAGIARPRGESFFICQPHVGQHVMDGLDGAFQGEPDADFLKGEIGLFGKKKTHPAAMGVDDEGLAAAAMMTGSDVSGVAALLDELFDHPERDLETASYLFTGSIAAIIGLEDTLPEIH